jgi:inosose dehydratase
LAGAEGACRAPLKNLTRGGNLLQALKQGHRREFLKRAGSLVLSCFASGRVILGAQDALPNPVGYAAISWPRHGFDHALATISRLGFKGAQFLGWVEKAYLGPKVETLRGRLNELKLQPVTLSCSGLSLDAGHLADVSAPFRAYANFFHQLEGKYLQMTDGGRPNGVYTADQIDALGRSMNELGRMAQDAGLVMGYHPHVGTLGETRHGLGLVLDATDPRYVKLIADVAHLTLGGSNPAEVIRTYRERLILCHFKDVRKEVAELYKRTPAAARHARYHFCEVGTGVVDFPAIVAAFRETRFDGWVIVELDDYARRPGGADESARMNKNAIEKLGFRI